MPADNGWDNYKLLVVDTLKRLEQAAQDHDRRDDERFEKLHETLEGIRSDISSLKFRSGVWGALAGMIPALAVLLVLYLESKA